MLIHNLNQASCSPFYGNRRPKLQRGAKLLCVSDLLLLGRTTIEEARSLLHWLDVEGGFGKMGICGLSMGESETSTDQYFFICWVRLIFPIEDLCFIFLTC